MEEAMVAASSDVNQSDHDNKGEGIFRTVAHKSMDPKSVWHYFKKNTVTATAKCDICDKIVKCSQGSTSGMRNHLKIAHNVKLASSVSASSSFAESSYSKENTSGFGVDFDTGLDDGK